MKITKLVAAIALPMLSASALADKVAAPFVADTADKFNTTVAEVHASMASGGHYEFISADNKTKVDEDIAKMSALFQQAGTVAAMSQEQKIQLFNTQEHLNGILTHSDRDRLICEHRAPVGTNIPSNTCHTFGELERARRADQKYLQDHASGPSLQHGN